ncbi:YceI family protein [Galbitalea sp. SE-J8]|uniref:YceI family protein n=1 Tax=Galbitalea sp. SE-J8 TaxID=3054952 RepID=UPI00259CBEF8|nr:YceI family protein [Galbitalea sp. SE-J8]MDM4764189.1 YceI family protein [Galbitalea sp. SE-J8]
MAITADAIPGYRTGTWTLDAAHSEISFSVRHLAISRVRGTFGTWDATVVTGEHPEDTTVTATIDVASVSTGQAQRDGHLRTSDFFAIDEFPQITFVSTTLSHDGSAYVLAGDLTLRGVTKPVTITGELGGITADAYGNTKAGASGTLEINRHDFGVSWNAATEAGGLTLGDKVTITIDAQFALAS